MNDPGLPRLLIVDDERAQMQALCDTLRDHGYVTEGVTGGHEALEAMAVGRFDLLLTDLMMPEMDGITLLKLAQKIDPDLVAVIMTGEGTITSAVEAMKAGALDYSLKPFKLSVILPVLSRALAMRRLRLENAELALCVRHRTAELEATNMELEAFSHSASHDLRAPLRAIAAYSHILMTDSADRLSADDVNLLGRISGSAKQMQALIDGLLNLSRSGTQALVKQLVSVDQIVWEILSEIRASDGPNRADVTVGDLPDVIGDPILLRQVFVNLLSNAVKFTANVEHPKIEIGARLAHDHVTYFVRDNGAGFDMKYVENLFTVFQRLHSSKQFEGSGVGLSIVERIVRRHGGRIWAEAAVEEGASFYFVLPSGGVDTEPCYAVTA